MWPWLRTPPRTRLWRTRLPTCPELPIVPTRFSCRTAATGPWLRTPPVTQLWTGRPTPSGCAFPTGRASGREPGTAGRSAMAAVEPWDVATALLAGSATAWESAKAHRQPARRWPARAQPASTVKPSATAVAVPWTAGIARKPAGSAMTTPAWAPPRCVPPTLVTSTIRRSVEWSEMDAAATSTAPEAVPPVGSAWRACAKIPA